MADEIWSVILLVGLIGWIGSTLAFIFRAFPARGRFEAGSARIWGACVIVFYCVWILGLLNA